MSDSINLIINLTNPDNNIRKSSELEFNSLLKCDPSNISLHLIESACNSNLSTDIRQSCLLNLRRIVPQFWSLSFGSFIGPPINQEIKTIIRKNLMDLALNTFESKLRNGSAYCITQIAYSDFPDEWPSLLNDLYLATINFENSNNVLGGLQVLNDLFDDFINEEQFWEGGICSQITDQLNNILNANLTDEIKIKAIALYESVLNILKSPEAFNNLQRKQFVINHVNQVLNIFINLLTNCDSILKGSIYRVIAILIGEFHKKINLDLKSKILKISLSDLSNIAPVYEKKALSSEEGLMEYKNVIAELLNTIACIQHDISIGNTLFVKDLIVCSILPNEKIEQYEADLNTYVSDISGLSTDVNIRESALDFLNDLNESDANLIFNEVINNLNCENWRILESELYILEGLMSGDAEIKNAPNLNILTQFIKDQSIVTSRVFILLPKYFEKFSDNHAKQVFIDMILFAEKSTPFIKVSALVSCLPFNQVLSFKELDVSIQTKIFQIVYSLIDECDEDGLPVLLEAINQAIIISPNEATSNDTIDLIFKISFKDTHNIQLVSDSSDCLITLLSDVNIENYINICEKSLPMIINIIKESKNEYNSDLILALEFLGIVIKSCPTEELPESIFNYIFPVLESILLNAIDDQILQYGGEVLNDLIQKSYPYFNSETNISILMNIIYKFLSPELSDSAANKSGLLVESLFSKFSNFINIKILSHILKMTVDRLVIAKEVPTIENLIMVFCQLVLKSPQEIINFLNSMNIENQSSLQVILPIWFESYEVTRGFENIKMNTLALAKIFSLNSSIIETIMVQGDPLPFDKDLIITRSKAKELKYETISAPLKILKLLIAELEFQQTNIQEENEELQQEVQEGDDDDDDGWEDVDEMSIPTFEKLKSYINDEKQHDQDESLKGLLLEFFKECTMKNLGNFENYYNQLTDKEKKILSDNLLF
ncbi:unnamed protein product [Candida verbasci]|uniref:Importin N-terminal domain-containing protein n=1 Tax=Candida verbasci TaxID=1227364 RepID=A0A9W4U1C5_9ASCO|nr:unnamed protein product [Candida verbasci]